MIFNIYFSVFCEILEIEINYLLYYRFAQLHTHICTYIYTHTHIYIHTYTHWHAYKHIICSECGRTYGIKALIKCNNKKSKNKKDSSNGDRYDQVYFRVYYIWRVGTSKIISRSFSFFTSLLSGSVHAFYWIN